ncbi:unnamed protein product [Closterium sp. Naga37s-1]|nr:unnamed protein product [Closterium sp. Naga37s-1]
MASTVVSAMEGAAGMEHAMSLYRVRQQRACAQAAATALASSSAPRYRCEPHSLPPSATAFHELEAPCPPCRPFMARPPSPSRLLLPPLNPTPPLSYSRRRILSILCPAPSLLTAWADAYGLSPDSLLPPSPLSLPPSLPPAPHLEDCAALTALRQHAEQRGQGGEPPAWAEPQPVQGVRGAQGEGEAGAACCRRAASGEASCEFKASVRVGAAANAPASPSPAACCTCVPQPPWVRHLHFRLTLTRESTCDSLLPFSLFNHSSLPHTPAFHSCTAPCCPPCLLLALPVGRGGETGRMYHGMERGSAEGCVQFQLFAPLLIFCFSPRLPVFLCPHTLMSSCPPSLAGASHVQVRGADSDNLALTRVVHIMAVLLSVALSSNRILVPLPASYGRANSSHCHAMGHGSSWSCFFAPITSPLCSQEVALALLANQLPPCVAPVEGYRAAAAAAERVVCVNTSGLNDLKFEASAAGLWGEAYGKDPDVVEQRGEVQLEGTEHKKLHWWRAQAVRFMLRWPSAHLCHVINQQRHTAYGMHVANRIARQAELHSQLQQSLPPLPPPTDSNAPSAAAAAEASAMAAAVAAAAAARFAGERSSDSTAAAAAAAAAAGGGGASGSSPASLACEPYMVRPIVSVHVRQSDKQVEMGVWSFAAHMLFAARLQRTLVDLKHHTRTLRCTRLSSPIPLRPPPATTVQSVINEAATPLYAGWNFLYAANGRLPEGALDPHEYDALQSPAASLASALIAAQCDSFIGSLGSNWSRLINELRATSGRLYSGFVAMNLGEW